MKKVKSSVLRAGSYRELGEFWDSHDLADYWDETKAVEFKITSESEVTYYPLENKLADKITSLAKRKRIPAGKLVNSWIREKLREEVKSP